MWWSFNVMHYLLHPYIGRHQLILFILWTRWLKYLNTLFNKFNYQATFLILEISMSKNFKSWTTILTMYKVNQYSPRRLAERWPVQIWPVLSHSEFPLVSPISGIFWRALSIACPQFWHTKIYWGELRQNKSIMHSMFANVSQHIMTKTILMLYFCLEIPSLTLASVERYYKFGLKNCFCTHEDDPVESLVIYTLVVFPDSGILSPDFTLSALIAACWVRWLVQLVTLLVLLLFLLPWCWGKGHYSCWCI